MPRTVAKFRRLGEWTEEKRVTVEDKNERDYIVIVETAEIVEVCTGNVIPRGRWRVRVETEARFRARTRSYSGDLAQAQVQARIQEIVESVERVNRPTKVSQ